MHIIPNKPRVAIPQGPPALAENSPIPSPTQSSTTQHTATTQPSPIQSPGPLPFTARQSHKNPTAIVYCEANFGEIDGKTANGLVRHSEKYDISSVIDSKLAGSDTGMVLDGKANLIPVCKDLADALTQAGGIADVFIYGMAPSSGMLSPIERSLLLEAMKMGMSLVNGLHEFLNEDPEFIAACRTHQVTIDDIRQPRAKKDLRMFTGRIAEVSCPRIAVLGTDCAIGKRTTATIIASALRERGLNVVLIGTGQTGLIQGARYGIAMDAVPSQFCAGELEAIILDAYETEKPDVILIEGQGALSHPAFSTTSFILRGSCPDAVVLQHAPGRAFRCDFDRMPMPLPASEINLIQTFSTTKVIGITINHEHMSDDEVSAAIITYEQELKIPATDALTRPANDLVAMVVAAFPSLSDKMTTCAP